MTTPGRAETFCRTSILTRSPFSGFGQEDEGFSGRLLVEGVLAHLTGSLHHGVLASDAAVAGYHLKRGRVLAGMRVQLGLNVIFQPDGNLSKSLKNFLREIQLRKFISCPNIELDKAAKPRFFPCSFSECADTEYILKWQGYI